jgi:hypothetical protein
MRFYYMNNKIMALPSTIISVNKKDQQFITRRIFFQIKHKHSWIE